MRERIRFLGLYYFFWVLFFVVARILFLAYHVADSKLLTLETVAHIFSNGIVMDMSMAAYLSFLPFLWVTFSNFLSKPVFQNSIFSYTIVMLILVNLIIVTDLEIFNIWNFRMDTTPLKFLTSPKQALISLKNSPLIRLFISFILITVAGGVIIYRLVANKIYDWKHIDNFPFIIYGLLLTSVLILAVRGGWGKGALKQKSVYFSQNYFANVSALNAPWNFGYSILKKVSSNQNPYTYLPKEILDNNIKSLFKRSGQTQEVINPETKTPNVLVIIVENFTSKVIDLNHKGKEITPFFNRFKNNGIYFDYFYSTADRSDKTLLSILSGYPSQPQDAILDYSDKLEKLPILSRDFNANGYSTQFYYGGDIGFLSIKPYLFLGNFEKLLGKDDFESTTIPGSLGVSDEVVYQKFIEEHGILKDKPFFSTILTVSGHEPFEIPGENLYETQDFPEKFFNAMNYTDRALKEFISHAQNQEWWDNTLVIILGNHGNKYPLSQNLAENYRIPLLFTGGVIKDSYQINHPFSQTDLASTLLAQFGINHSAYNWSKNIFDNEVIPWAFFTFNDGFGYINAKSRVIFDNVGQQPLQSSKVENPEIILQGKAIQQRSYQDFLDL